jgi:ketosteroid isomerase-like protein
VNRRRSIVVFAGLLGLTIPPAATSAWGQALSGGESIRLWLEGYVTAFNAKDLDRLGAFYDADVTIFEGGTVDRGWAAYRDHHLGPELREFDNLQFSHSNVAVHMLADRAAYVTADYSLRARVKGRPVDSQGLETLVVFQVDDGTWRIRHAHTSSRRRPAPTP